MEKFLWFFLVFLEWNDLTNKDEIRYDGTRVSEWKTFAVGEWECLGLFENSRNLSKSEEIPWEILVLSSFFLGEILFVFGGEEKRDVWICEEEEEKLRSGEFWV